MPDDSMENLDQPATRRDLQELATRRDLVAVEELATATRNDLTATRREMAALRNDLAALESKMDARFDDLHRHFDVSVEAFHTDIRNINGLAHRVVDLEDGHGRRLTSLELRTTRLERRKK